MRAGLTRWSKQTWNAALGFCFPSLCLFCEKREPQDDSRFCAECDQTCQSLAPRQCARCAAPLGPYVDTQARCVHCRDDSYAFDSAYCLGPYADPLRSACLRAKLAGGHALTCDLADQLWQRHGEALRSLQLQVVIPVPHLWSEQLWKPHSTPVTLAECFAAHLQVPTGLDLLAKIKRTAKQALLPVTARRQNLKGAFGIARRTEFFGTRILLVDDIMTTGTTSHECAKVLKQAGASEVHVVVIGRVT